MSKRRGDDQTAGLLSDPNQYDSALYTDQAPTSTAASRTGSVNDAPEKRGLLAKIGQKLFKGDAKVALYALGLLVFSTGNSIFFKKMSNKMINYPYFLTQLTSFVAIPIFFAIVLYEFKFTNYITPEMTSFPKRKFAAMGAFDSLSGIFMLFGSVHTSGSFQALLNNAVIPFTMVMSIVFLKTKYVKTQYAGAFIIMAGVCTVMIPLLIHPSSTDTSNEVVFNGLFLLSTIPQAFSSIYKEIAFGDIDLDVNYLQAWVVLFQFFIGIILAPVNSLPFLADAYVPFLSIPDTFANGAKCMIGHNSIVNHTVVTYGAWNNVTQSNATYAGSCWMDTNEKWGAPSDTHCDDCSEAYVPIIVYICFNCLYNLFIVLTIKYGSAALLWIILTVRLPLVQIAFAISAINNPPDQFKITSIIGLIIILSGLICYRYSSVAGKTVNEDGEEVDDSTGDGDVGGGGLGGNGGPLIDDSVPSDLHHTHMIDDPNMLHSDSYHQRFG